MQRHPILLSRVVIDRGSRDRYFWQSLVNAPP
jgi:hypothetical protein